MRGKRLRTLRKKEGLTQKELAKKLGVTNSHVCNWEAGMCLPNKENAEKINNVFGEVIFEDDIPCVSHKVDSLLEIARGDKDVPTGELITIVNKVCTEYDTQENITRAISLWKWRTCDE